MATKTIASGTVADAYLELLADRGIDYLFANAGTDFAPLIEAYAKAQAHGTKVPKPITVPHENVAIAMAQGYYLKTGRPQAVMVHVNVGTANAICGLINGWRGNIPVLFTAGRTPYSEEGALMGMRSGEIHWPQEMRDQRAMVREFVKWDYELPNGEVLESAVDRALNIAMTEPMGPVYMTLPRETLAAPITNFRYTSPSRHATPTRAFPDPNAIDQAADMLAAAEFPLIITRAAGRVETDVAKLAALAERFAIPVFERKHHYMCMPANSPMHLGSNPEAYFDVADVIVVLECRCALGAQAQGAAAQRQDHPYRRGPDLRELSVARISVRSGDHRSHRGDPAFADAGAGIACADRRAPHRCQAQTDCGGAREPHCARIGQSGKGEKRFVHPSGLDQPLHRCREGR